MVGLHSENRQHLWKETCCWASQITLTTLGTLNFSGSLISLKPTQSYYGLPSPKADFSQVLLSSIPRPMFTAVSREIRGKNEKYGKKKHVESVGIKDRTGERETAFSPWCLFLTSSNFQVRLPVKWARAEEVN